MKVCVVKDWPRQACCSSCIDDVVTYASLTRVDEGGEETGVLRENS